MPSERPLIVGAGPTGLAAALLLSHHGAAVRIIDAAPEPSPWSKAIAVNPRTLEILQPTGLTERILATGHPITHAELHAGWATTTKLDVSHIHPRFGMTALSQARTEELLRDALAARGVAVERGVRLAGLAQDASGVTARLSRPDGADEEVRAPLLFGADGAHSTVRHALGLGFDGSALPEPWPLYDIRLETDLAFDAAHIALFDEGMLFLIAFEPGHWRVLGNVPDVLDRLPPGARAGEILWQSEFHISHRVASAAAVGRVALGGDAAHIHSPVGARGLNLGIEDAHVFAACAADALAGRPERIAEYGRLRHPVHRSVVRRIALITRLVRGRPGLLRRVRDVLVPVVPRLPVLGTQMMKTLSGLDHELAVT